MSNGEREFTCRLEIDWDAVDAARARGALVVVTEDVFLYAPPPESAPEPARGDWEAAGWQAIGATEEGRAGG